PWGGERPGDAGLAGVQDGGLRSQEEVGPVPGTRITDQQVRLYMNIRKVKSQALSAAKAGISERSARRIDGAATLPSQNPRRYWRSCPDPFADVFDTEVVPLIRRAVEGPPKEVFFPQEHAPGHRCLSAFTAMGDLRVTIANEPFAHILYHFV